MKTQFQIIMSNTMYKFGGVDKLIKHLHCILQFNGKK